MTSTGATVEPSAPAIPERRHRATLAGNMTSTGAAVEPSAPAIPERRHRDGAVIVVQDPNVELETTSGNQVRINPVRPLNETDATVQGVIHVEHREIGALLKPEQVVVVDVHTALVFRGGSLVREIKQVRGAGNSKPWVADPSSNESPRKSRLSRPEVPCRRARKCVQQSTTVHDARNVWSYQVCACSHRNYRKECSQT